MFLHSLHDRHCRHRRRAPLPGGVLIALCCGFGAMLSLQAGESDLETIKQRLIQKLLQEAEPKTPSTQGQTGPLELARKHAAELQADGSWQGIDYADKGRAEWKPQEHLTRVRAMSLGCRLAPDDADLKSKTRLALKTWIAKDCKSDNWWWNDIGAPIELGKTLLLLQPDLPAEEINPALQRLGRVGIDRTGQNRVWLAGIALTHAALLNDKKLAHDAVNAIAGTITVDQEEGIQPDWSFFQHGPCLYSAGYGLGFSVDCSVYMALTQGTEFAFPEQAATILSQYMLDGQCWMVRGDGFDPGAAGREICRPKSEKKGRPLAYACERLAAAGLPRRVEFAAAARRMMRAEVGGADEPDGDRYFWKSALLVHRRPAYYFSIRMARSDLHSGDGLINGENLRSQYLADGVTYLMKTGAEFNQIFGAWDWRRPPGVTNRDDAPFDGRPNEKGRRAFAGAATDGRYSVAAMDWANPVRGDGFPAEQLEAHKAWFCFDREIVCLGAGITCAGDHPVVTSVNQSLLAGEVTVAPAKPGDPILPPQRTITADLTGPTWVHADGVGYWVGAGTRLKLAAGPRTGSWNDCNANLPKTDTTLPIFGLVIDHGAKPQNAAYAYTVLPDCKPADLAAYAQKPAVEVLSNTADLQAVRHTQLGIVAAAFYQPGTLTLPGDGGTLKVDRACLVLIRPVANGAQSISLCKPDAGAQKPGEIVVIWQGTELKIALPDGVRAGSSVSAQLK